ncbi:hypothetical protein KUL118_13270 [Tenacibaculum sp. KUL118]|nr:hypothetical protein BACT7_06840 [Tenacibaculum mesophilum]BFF39104.1 hypothetical protein BACY1_09090 [Tenacibaculum mesophilum]GFD78465.1 hypothetical protein KUL118_13270 [Tenacibaculum sp. KUL118]
MFKKLKFIKMKTIKLITILALATLTIFTSCQSEENEQVGTNPNANTPTSETAKKYKRTGMNDGSEDDFLDGNSCAELLFPITATINGKEVTIINELDYSLVLEIMDEFNDDDDTVVFNFPITVKLNNYTEVTITSQTELEELNRKCDEASDEMEDAISCAKIEYPISMLTYDVNLEQTGTVVIESEKQLYNFVDSLDSSELFSVKYPITITLNNGSSVKVNSDSEFEDAIEECTSYEEEEEAAEVAADELETIISKAKFKVESFIQAGVEKADEYAAYTIEFTNEGKLIARNIVNTTLENIEGEYDVESDTRVLLEVEFEAGTVVSALGNEWVVTTYTSTLLTLQSTTDTSITLTFKKI